MIFQHTIDKVLSGEKTQTRRRVKPTHGECYLRDDYTGEPLGILAVGTGKSWLYRCGKTYAVQPGRGKPAVARIRVTGIRREDVRTISDDDVKAEGFGSRDEFLSVWTGMHGQQYDAWVIEFELVREAQS